MRKHLYRFISFEDFINLVINNKDRFVRPSIWDDGYEGYLFAYLDSPEDVRHIVSEMFNNLCPRNYYAIPEKVTLVGKESFIPSPEVDSEVIKLNIRKEPPVKLL